ncbi:hypothetical protein ACFJGV_16920 [Cnuibacter sp. UC19_7]|uniref:hypothetical protein n=1 Tax=Cnuibacter sp. UC19_7 TaxID=3350166 RepID=UPI00366D9A8C
MTPRSTLLRIAAALVTAAIFVGLAGCQGSGSGAADAAATAEWVQQQPGVLGATATADPSPFSGEIAVDVTVDPSLDDDALRQLVRAVSDHYADSEWTYPTVVFALDGEGRFSDREEAFLPLFLRLRSGGGFSAVDLVDGVSAEVASSDPADLLEALARLQELARESGGVQSNLSFSVHAPDETVWVTGTYTEAPGDAAAVAPTLVAGVPTVRVQALAIETGAQVLSIVVLDESARSLVEERATSIDGVEVRVWLADELEEFDADAG